MNRNLNLIIILVLLNVLSTVLWIHFEELRYRALLEAEGVDPHIPWLYNFKLDFRFQ